tara:strand:- start:1067 stop:1297 length:231 start_codon:yes stop_codon:yes gene_type:complete
MAKVHYHGTWESPETSVGTWHIEVRGSKYFCFWNNKLMHHIYEGKPTIGEAIKMCEDHYHDLKEAERIAKTSNRTS